MMRVLRKRWIRVLAGVVPGVLAVPTLAFFALNLAFPFPKESLIAAQSGGSALVLDRTGG